MLNFYLLLWVLSTANGSEYDRLEAFAGDVIQTWQLISPTIIVGNDLFNLCLKSQWVLCLTIKMDTSDLAEHLSMIHQQRKQDGIIFIGGDGQDKIVKHLAELAPTIFSSNCPVFMPIEYAKYIKLRLDSNLIFYNKEESDHYELIDQFAVKGGPTVQELVGYWEIKKGITFHKKMNRWERRNNLKGATLVNCLLENGIYSDFITDKSGTLIGSKGYFPDMLFLITYKLNLTVKTVKSPWTMELMENGSWTGEIGFLQRKDVDVVSSGLGINLQRSDFIDYPLPTDRSPLTLIAAIPKKNVPNIWVYVRVFGVQQWIIFISLLVLTVIGLTLGNGLSKDEAPRIFGTKKGAQKEYKLNSVFSGFALLCLFTIQMGSHTNSKQLAQRLLTLTASFLTLLLFVYYTTDITAEMTAGTRGIQIRTFEDVIHHNYKVISNSPYSEAVLSESKPGTAKREVYDKHYENINTKNKNIQDQNIHILQKVISDPKTLYYAQAGSIIPEPSDKILTDQVFTLKMDDAFYGAATLPLQKESEFLQLFNHKILLMIQSGLLNRLHLNYFRDLYVKENFEMIEPQPLGFNNVMFPFICLGIGIVLSIVKAISEFMIMKLKEKWATSTQARQTPE